MRCPLQSITVLVPWNVCTEFTVYISRTTNTDTNTNTYTDANTDTDTDTDPDTNTSTNTNTNTNTDTNTISDAYLHPGNDRQVVEL